MAVEKRQWPPKGQTLSNKVAKKRLETLRLKKLMLIEEQIRTLGYQSIAGVDEAGRGPLAGPVVAAACILPQGYQLRGIDDSKRLTAEQRFALYQELIKVPFIGYGIGVVEALEIDQLNILQASLKAMSLAIQRLPDRPDFILVDGNFLPLTGIPGEAVVDGDALSQAIAAASILAKVTRDQIMIGYDQLYPGYFFSKNKGYGTKDHLEALMRHGPSPIHRKSFLHQAEEKRYA